MHQTSFNRGVRFKGGSRTQASYQIRSQRIYFITSNIKTNKMPA